MTQSRTKRVLEPKHVYWAGEVFAVVLAALLIWAKLTAPFNFRQPVPSPDGKYFAYFDLIDRKLSALQGGYDLIVSTVQGTMAARFRMIPGVISWSNAAFLAVVDFNENRARLVSNNDGRFLTLKDMAFAPATEPLWSEDGTKLAYFPPASQGGGIAVYDFQQTQTFTIPLSREFKLIAPLLLFWSPGSNELFFLNREDQSEVLVRIGVHSGEFQKLAKGSSTWKEQVMSRPRMSPDGKKIYLPPPLHSVIDAETGEKLWTLPIGSKALWSMWSEDGRQFFYSQDNGSWEIYKHEFAEGRDRLILTRAEPRGFLAPVGRNYIYLTSRPPAFMGVASLFGEWANRQWGWQQLDLATGKVQGLGRAELNPLELTQDGSMFMARDSLARVHYGLYEPSRRSFSEFTFPTDWEDVFRQVKTEIVVILSTLFYGLVVFLVHLTRRDNPPARALCFLSLSFMILFASLSALDAVLPLASSPVPSQTSSIQVIAVGWMPIVRRLWFVEGSKMFALAGAALVLPALLHFSFVFPDQNSFLNHRTALKTPLFAAAFSPLIALFLFISGNQNFNASYPILVVSFLLASTVVVLSIAFALLHSYRHPRDRRAQEQTRWVSLALAGPPVGFAALVLLVQLVNNNDDSWTGYQGQDFIKHSWVHALAVLCLVPTLGIGYSLIAPKPFSIRLLIRRGVHYALLIFFVAVANMFVLSGLSWAAAKWSPSQSIAIVAALLTALMVLPAANRLQSVIDRTIDRSRYELLESLQKLSFTLPALLDHQTLEARIREGVTETMHCRSFHLFILDRAGRKFGLLAPKSGVPPEVASIEFDPAEPLSRHLSGKGHSFEVEVAPYDPKLVSTLQSVAERVGKLDAALILGLVRRHELVGLMMLGAKPSEEFYDTEEIQLLRRVANQAAAALENTELLREVARGREIHEEMSVVADDHDQTFTVAAPNSRTCSIVGRCQPAKSVGGDYYDFLELTGERIGVAIGEVSSKGSAAAQLMRNVQTLLRAQSPQGMSPAELLRQINRQLYGTLRGAKSCAFFYGVYNERDRRLVYSNAGHQAPLLRSSAGIRSLDSAGVPLGLFPEVAHEVQCEKLEPGELILLYSDGIIRARSPNGENYGINRLVECLKRADHASAADLVPLILDDVRNFACGTPTRDDQTIVVLQVRNEIAA